MPGSLNLRLMAPMALGLAVGAGWMAAFDSREAPLPAERLPISMASSELAGKRLALISVDLRVEGLVPDSEAAEVTLLGRVRLNQNVDGDLRFRWELPAGVHVVDGEEDGVLTGFAPGQTGEVRLTVTGFSTEELRLIALHAFMDGPGTRLGNTALLTSRPQDSYEMLSVAAGVQREPSSSTNRPLLTGPIVR